MKKLSVCVIVLALMVVGCASKRHDHMEYTTHSDVQTMIDMDWVNRIPEVKAIAEAEAAIAVEEATAKALMHLHDYSNLQNPVLFEENKSELTGATRVQLIRKAELLKKYPRIGLEVIGKASRKGTFAHNSKLSIRRAYLVQQFLIAQGIGHDRLSYVARGYTDSTGGYPYDRRVEFKAVLLKEG